MKTPVFQKQDNTSTARKKNEIVCIFKELYLFSPIVLQVLSVRRIDKSMVYREILRIYHAVRTTVNRAALSTNLSGRPCTEWTIKNAE